MKSNYEDTDSSREEMLSEAAVIFDIIIPKDNQLSLDIDTIRYTEQIDKFFWTRCQNSSITYEQEEKLSSVLNYLNSEYIFESVEMWASKSGRTHVLITYEKDIPAIERCLYQSLLGSDPIREMLNLRRIQHNVKNPIALFKPKASSKKKNILPDYES